MGRGSPFLVLFHRGSCSSPGYPKGFSSQQNAVHLRESSLPQKCFREHLSQIADLCESFFKEEMACVGSYEFGSKV